MGPLLVEAAGLMLGRVVVAGSGPGGGLGAVRLPPLGTVGRGRQLRRVAPAALGNFGVDWGCLHSSRYYVCGVLKGAAGGHDDVCFAFGRNPACR